MPAAVTRSKADAQASRVLPERWSSVAWASSWLPPAGPPRGKQPGATAGPDGVEGAVPGLETDTDSTAGSTAVVNGAKGVPMVRRTLSLAKAKSAAPTPAARESAVQEQRQHAHHDLFQPGGQSGLYSGRSNRASRDVVEDLERILARVAPRSRQHLVHDEARAY